MPEETPKPSKRKSFSRKIGNVLAFPHRYLQQRFPGIRTKHYVFALGGLLILGGYLYSVTPKPAISLELPKENTISTEKKLYVRGKVKPAGTTVSVNGAKADTDGNGTFTVFVSLPVGQSVLTIDANYFGKHATYVEPITRQLSAEEQMQLAQKKAQQEQEARAKVLSANKKIDSLVDADKSDFVHIVRVISQDEKKSGTYSNITGEVINSTANPAYWVKVTANFYNASDQIVDKAVGYAVSKAQSLAPGKTAPFTTQSTTTPHLYYKLTVDWQDKQYVSTNSAEFGGNDPSSGMLSPTPTTAALPPQAVTQ